MTFRWTQEAIDAFEKRSQEWKAKGTVRTHRIKDDASEPRKHSGGRKSKYGAIKTEANGIMFASKREKNRWMDLRIREMAGGIKDLRRQVAYPLEVNGMKVCDYIADFVYHENEELVVEDSKGVLTPVFELKKKLMRAVHGIEVKLT